MATIEDAVAAIKAGDTAEGREIIAELLKADRNNEQAWLWLTQTDITLEQKIKSLQKVLKINPDNEIAKAGLRKLQQRKAKATRPPPSKESTLIGSQITDRLKTKQGRPLLIALGVAVSLVCGICLVFSLFSLSQRSPVSPASLPPIEPTAIPVVEAGPLPAIEPAAIPPVEAGPLPATSTPMPAQAPLAATTPDNGLVEALVINVVDGDTIDVLIDGLEYRVRYILVDTPETFGEVEPFGPEASATNRALVDGKRVRLEKDVSEKDRFGRLLRYVYVDDLMINEELLRLGLATVATFPPDVKYVDQFLAIQQQAQADGVGIWGETEASQPVQPTQPPPATEPPQASEPPPQASGGVIIQTIRYDGLVTRVESDEYAEIANTGPTGINIGGWRLNADDPGQDFIFPDFVLEPGQVCRVYTNQSHPESCGFSFGSGQALWANGGECGTLYDSGGGLVSEFCYE